MWARGDVLRRAFGHDAAALGAGLGADLENPVGGFEHVEVVLDDDHAVAALDELLQHVEQAPHVVPVQPGGGFVQRRRAPAGGMRFWVLGLLSSGLGAPALKRAEVADELEALGFAAAEGVERLAQREIAEADLLKRGRAAAGWRDGRRTAAARH